MFRSQTIGQSMLALLVSLLAFTAQAQNLSDSDIQAFIATMHDAQTLQDKYEDTEGWPDPASEGMDSMPDMNRLFSAGVERMKGTAPYNDFEDIIKKHGFDSIKSWASVGDRIFAAMIAIEMKSEAPGATREIEQAMAEIENSPDMTAQQKAQMRAMMGAAMSATKMADNVPAADIEALRPHLKALEASMGGNED